MEPRKPKKESIPKKICTEREQDRIAQQPDDQLNQDWGKTIFCIKETLYKVFNPIHPVFLGFQEAEVELNPGECSFTVDIDQREMGIQCAYSGRFSMDAGFIVASTLLEAKVEAK